MTDVVQVQVSGLRGPAGIDHKSPLADRPGKILSYGADPSGRSVVAIAGATPANAVAATDLAAPTGGDLVGTSRGSVEQRFARAALYAADYGIVDDPNVGTPQNIDQRVAVQNFEILCRALRRDRNYSALRIAVGSPGIIHHGGRILFDGCSVGPGDPGFYPLYGASGYDVLTILGRSGGRVMVSGWGADTLAFDAANVPTVDHRPQVNAIVIGGDQALDETANRCVFEHISTPCIAGVGVDLYGVFDSVFHQIAMEDSGKLGSPAFRIRDGNPDQGQTSNELTIGRLQVERAVGQAIDIAVTSLSINVDKIHSEGARGIAGTPTWRLGGASSRFGPIRLAALTNAGQDTTLATALLTGASTEMGPYRAEGVLTQYSALSGSSLTVTEPGGRFTPYPNQVGMIRFRGGGFSIENADGYTLLDGCTVSSMTCGFAAPGTRTVAINCAIGSLATTSTQAALDCIACTVALTPTQGFRSLRLFCGTEMKPTTGTDMTFGYQYVGQDETSHIVADLKVDFAGFDWRGKVLGKVAFTTQFRTIVGGNASATVAVTGYTPPNGGEYIGAPANGQRTSNPAWVPGATPGWIYSTADNTWHPEPVVA